MAIKLDQLRARLTSDQGNWLSRLGAMAVLAVAIVVGAALSAFLFGFFLVLAAVAGIWLWWQQWKLKRRVRRSADSGTGSSETRVIQGEYEVVDEEQPHQRQADDRRTGTRSDHDQRPPPRS